MTPEEFIEQIEKEANKIGFQHVSKGEQSIKIDLSWYTGMNLKISVDKERKPEFSCWFRTNSAVYMDERTDIHDTISVTFAILLRCLNLTSSQLFDFGHPAGSELDSTEIYARYLIPTQTSSFYYQLNEKGVEAFKELLVHTYLFEQYLWKAFGGCPCATCRNRLGITYDYKNEIDAGLQSIIHSTIGKTENYNLKDRPLPTWHYYRDFDKKITIVKSQALAEFLTIFVEKFKYEEVPSISGKLIMSNDIKNYVSSVVLKKAKKLLGNLEGYKKIVKYVTIDNKLIAVGDVHLIMIDTLGGLSEFKLHRDKLRLRHNREFELLFAPTKITWKPKLNEEAFENLVKDLLEREPAISWIRKVAHTNEPDGGRDLIACVKVNQTRSENLSEKTTPYLEKKLIVQCKAYSKGVGKSDVIDIRDTIEYNGHEGYFLAVSSYLKRSLTDHLDNLRVKNTYWIDWWTRQEIDERLKRNPDILNKYSELFE